MSCQNELMYRFHVNLFGKPFQCTWEEVAAKLETFPRMMFELDGSWILSGGVGPTRWQLDGHLFDFNNRLHRVEIHGECPKESFDQLLTCFGWPETELVFEQVLEGVQLNEEEFRSAAQQ